MAVKITDKWIGEQVRIMGRGGAPEVVGRPTWDSELKGFGLRWLKPTKLHPTGARSFFISYWLAGVEKRFKIGNHPEWTAEAARAEARDLRRRIDRGEDPARDRKERREAPTVRDLSERYRADHLPTKAPSSQVNDWAMIQNDILPAIGDRKVADVHEGDIEALLRAITKRGRPVRANRVRSVISIMFSLAMKRREGEEAPWRSQAQGNPCKGVARNHEEGHERFFSQAELAAISDALGAYGKTPAADCIRFIALTGCRPGEAMHATWEQVDAEPGFWVKPSSHTKQRKLHRVPLGPAAIELIAEIRERRESDPRRSTSEYIFPGQGHGEPLKQLRSTWEAVAEAASIALWRDGKDPKVAALVADMERSLRRPPTVKEVIALAQGQRLTLPPAPHDARLYDLRHSFASIGAGGGLSLQIIGRLLGHTQMRTTMRYAHLADDPLKEAATRITATIAGAGKHKQNVSVLR